MRTPLMLVSLLLAAFGAAGCAGGGARPEDDGGADTAAERPARGGRKGRLPDPLPAGVEIIPEDQMTPAQLVDALGSLDAARRSRAHDRLQRLGGSAEAELRAGLSRSEEPIRAQCAHVFGVLGEPTSGLVDALVAMVEQAEDAPEARQQGLWALGRLRVGGGERDTAGRTAFQYLNHPDTGVRSHAAEAIRRLGYRPAVERLIGLLDPRNDGAPQTPLERQYLRDALRDITFEDFGLDAAAWDEWWSLNADRVFGA
jgi:HEAT repeat protein